MSAVWHALEAIAVVLGGIALYLFLGKLLFHVFQVGAPKSYLDRGMFLVFWPVILTAIVGFRVLQALVRMLAAGILFSIRVAETPPSGAMPSRCIPDTLPPPPIKIDPASMTSVGDGAYRTQEQALDDLAEVQAQIHVLRLKERGLTLIIEARDPNIVRKLRCSSTDVES